MVRIRDIYIKDRPREKLNKLGPGRLKDYELLALILGSGVKGVSVLQLSKKILDKYSIKDLTELKIIDLLNFKGLGKVGAFKIIATIELAKRIKTNKRTIIYSPKDIWRELKNIREKRKEHFIVFCLDSRNKIIKKELISIGTLNASLVHPREVFEPAIRNLSAQIVIAHNHPSEDVNPSEEDIGVTNKLSKAGNLMGIEIIDHVIVSKNKFLSFKARGYI